MAQLTLATMERGTIFIGYPGIRHNSFEGDRIWHKANFKHCAKFHLPKMSCALFQCPTIKLCLMVQQLASFPNFSGQNFPKNSGNFKKGQERLPWPSEGHVGLS